MLVGRDRFGCSPYSFFFREAVRLRSERKFLVGRKILSAAGALFRFEMKSRKGGGREDRKGKGEEGRGGMEEGGRGKGGSAAERGAEEKG